MMTDPIADFLTRIRNGNLARKERIDVPWSKMKERIAKALVDEGYLGDYSVVSRPSLRVYVGAASAPRIRRGYGVALLSTPQGVLPDHEARARKVGGEVLCAVW